MSNPSFVHLHVHSEYSLVDGIVRLQPLMHTLAERGSMAVALTDQSNAFAVVKFYQAARQAGIKPILGADLYLNNPNNEKQPFRITVLCQTNAGYLNLLALLSRMYQQGQANGIARIESNWLTANNTNGLIVLLGMHSDLGQALLQMDHQQSQAIANQWQTLFSDRLYLELVRTDRAQEDDYITAVIALAIDTDIPVVATNDVRFLTKVDYDAHEARVCIHQGRVLADSGRSRDYSPMQYLRSADDMQQLFADIPEALLNSVEIAKRCNVTLTLGEHCLPEFPVPAGMSIATYFQQQAEVGLQQRLQQLKQIDNSLATDDVYRARLTEELTVINRMEFAGYFLIVADFIQWAKHNGVSVGPGRGSGAGSLVAYALGITDLDPLRYELLFERFLNPERISMPDFDIDFCMDGRDKVIDYVTKRYGRDSVSQIITYGTMAAKAVVRDVGRVLGFPYGFVDQIAKLIPFELGMTLTKALAQEEMLHDRYQNEDDVHALLDLAMKLEGITRNAGKHAGGVVIAPSKLTDFTALYCEPGGVNLVTQLDKDDVESVGLVKFDFLGLRTLTIIDWSIQAINIKRADEDKAPIDINVISLTDQKTFSLLQSCQTTAIFQLESRGMKDLIKRLVPDCFEDIIALVALFRPGPLQSGMVDDFIDRKHGRAVVEYPHPDLEPILKPTYGVILYQEQVMQIAQVLAGYTLGAADMLRRAMGKKKPEEMAKQRAVFVAGASERRVNGITANHIFDLMEKFAGYGFNKSHSAAYALVSYQTAWLKTHYPSEFMAAVLSSDMDNTDKIVNLIEECRQLSLRALPPDVNQGDYKFTVNAQQQLVYGLGAIKGVGQSVIDEIVNVRNQQGEFRDLFDFCMRVDLTRVNRRALEALIRAGAMDSFNTQRASLFASLERAIQAAEQAAHASVTGQADLFGLADTIPEPVAQYVDVPAWSDAQRLQGEKETLGLYISGHPLNAYQAELCQFTQGDIAQLQLRDGQTVLIAGIITAIRTMRTRRGDRMAFVTIEDQSARIEVAVFSDLYQNARPLIVKDNLVVISGDVSADDYTGGYKISANTIYSLTQAREQYARCLKIQLNQAATPALLQQLHTQLQPFCGGRCQVVVYYQQQAAQASFVLGEQWRIHPEETLLAALNTMLGENAATMQYQTTDEQVFA